MTRAGWLPLAVLLLLVGAVGVILLLNLPTKVLIPQFLALYGVVILALVVLSLALHRARDRASDSADDLAAIQGLSGALSGSHNPGDMLAQVLDTVLELTHAAAVRLWLANSETQTLVFRLYRGPYPEILNQPSIAAFGDVPAGRAAATNQTLLLSDPREIPELHDKGFVEFACVPVSAGGRLVAVLDIAARHNGELAPSVLRRLETVGPSLGLAIVNAERIAAAERHADGVRRLWQAGMEIVNASSYERTLRAVADRARELVRGEAAAVCLWDEQKQWWAVHGTSGPGDAFDANVRRMAVAGVNAGCPTIRSKYRRSQLDVPVESSGRVVGCLCVAAEGEREFSMQENELLVDLADQAAIAIDGARRADQVGERAVVAERERLAREMHDTLAQLLGFVSFKAQATRELLVQGQSDRALGELDHLMTISQDLYADTRELILGLNSETGPEHALVPALDDYVRRFGQLSGITSTLEPDGVEGVQFAPLVEVQLIRIVQEALSNVRKHAHAMHAKVRLERKNEFARITIEDDGQGFDPKQRAPGQWPRFGMQSMRERVESVGGTLAVRSARGEGTQITVQVPIVYRGAD